MNNQDVLIRLLKEGHISEMEFKNLYALTNEKEPELVINPIQDFYYKDNYILTWDGSNLKSVMNETN